MSWLKHGHEASKAGGAKPLKEQLTEPGMAKMVHVFVGKEKPDDYKCGNCNMRVLINKDPIADCTIVKGGVHLTQGVCSYWSHGEDASSKEDIHDERMTYEESGYEETPSPGDKVQCGTCYYYETIDEKQGNCKLWMGQVKKGQCCMAYKNEQNKIPTTVHLKEEETKP